MSVHDDRPADDVLDEVMALIQADEMESICLKCHEFGEMALEPDGRVARGCDCGGDLVGLEEFLFHFIG